MKDKISVVIGGQAGSESKGSICARLHYERDYSMAVRVGGPNAGHTVIDRRREQAGRAWALRQLPVAAIADPACMLAIGPGSEIDLDVLHREIAEVEETGIPVRSRLLIDPEAQIVTEEHKAAETAIRTGTTGKGIGAARAARAMRDGAIRAGECFTPDMLGDTAAQVRALTRHDKQVMVEGTQGYILGTHAGEYPYVTSGDCSAAAAMQMAGIPPQDVEVWLVMRTFPIRIAGESGPMAEEVTWEEIGVEPELTTVTQKVRRVGRWDWDWAERAARAHDRPGQRTMVALTFVNYWWPGLRDMSELPADDRRWGGRIWGKVHEIESRLQVQVGMLGTGPDEQILLQPEAWL